MRLIRNTYKLLIVDIDGTLLDKKGAISAEDKRALAKVREAGILVSLSTGRAAPGCSSIINQLALDGYHIFFDGALVSNPKTGEEIYAQPLSPKLAKQIIEYVHRDGIHLDLYSATQYFVERETWATGIRREFFRLQPTVVDFNQIWPKERVIKGTLVVASTAEKARAEKFRRHFANSLTFSWTKTPAYPEVDFINVLAPGVSKGQALAALATYLRVAMNNIMAIGDGTNDISLLSVVGLAIAMGNAVDELKAIADDVTLDVDHSGVAAAVDKFLLSARSVGEKRNLNK